MNERLLDLEIVPNHFLYIGGLIVLVQDPSRKEKTHLATEETECLSNITGYVNPSF